MFNGKQIDLVSMKEDKYKNVSISGKVFDISSGLSIAVKQALDEKWSNFELKEQFTSGLHQCKIVLNQLKIGTNNLTS